MSVKVACPNCMEPATKTGNVIVCEACDATFKITQTGPAKVKSIGELEDLKNRVAALEQTGKPKEQPAEDDEGEDDSGDDDEGELLPR